jgi:hypothetical protein
MVKTEIILVKPEHQSIRYCGNCKKEYTFGKYIGNHPKSHHDQLRKLWYNQQIQFYCSYCYLLKIIKKINKEKKLRI